MTRQKLLARLDGTLADPGTPFVLADDLGVVRGDGVFESILGVDGVPRDLDAHLDRLAASARLIELPAPDLGAYRRAAEAIVEGWDWAAAPEAMIRLVQTRGPEGGEGNGWALAVPLDEASRTQRRDGVRVVLLDRGFDGAGVASLPWLLPGAKTLSYGINMAAKRYAVANGADDAIFTTPSGTLLEGPTSSVVLDLDGRLVTPPLDGILDSITVQHLRRDGPAAGMPLHTGELTRDDLARARGGWLLSSGRILARITAVDGAAFAASPLDARLRALLDVPGGEPAS